jgi:hypothetical protein
MVIGVYIRCVASGDTIRTPKTAVMAKTLAGYATAAGRWCALHFGLQVSIYLPTTLAGKASLHPFLAETILQRRKWQQPKATKEPYTTPMLHVLRHDVISLARDHL